MKAAGQAQDRTRATPPPNVVKIDGVECIKRAGQLWMSDKTGASYMGRTVRSFQNWCYENHLKRIKHGKITITSKADIDTCSGSLPE